MYQIGLEAIFEPSATGSPTSTNIGLDEQIDVYNVPSGGKLYEVKKSAVGLTITPEATSGK
jgi:hypothetical protein